MSGSGHTSKDVLDKFTRIIFVLQGYIARRLHMYDNSRINLIKDLNIFRRLEIGGREAISADGRVHGQ